MKFAIPFLLAFLGLQKATTGQTYTIIGNCTDSTLALIKNIIILEPIVEFDTKVIKTVIEESLITTIKDEIDYRFKEISADKITIRDSITIDLDKVDLPDEYDAILIVECWFGESIIDNLNPNHEVYSYFTIRMNLYDKQCQSILQVERHAPAGDNLSVNGHPIEAAHNATKRSIKGMLKEIYFWNLRK